MKHMKFYKSYKNICFSINFVEFKFCHSWLADLQHYNNLRAFNGIDNISRLLTKFCSVGSGKKQVGLRVSC